MIEIYAIMVNRHCVIEVINTIGTHYRVKKFWYNNKEVINIDAVIELLTSHKKMLGEYNSVNQEMELFVIE